MFDNQLTLDVGSYSNMYDIIVPKIIFWLWWILVS